MEEAREERIAHNETLFREAAVRASAHGASGDCRIAFHCECSRLRCTRPIELTAGEFERARSKTRRLVQAPGHDLPEEKVVERHARYVVVER
jgi:hypothetical protein